MTHKPIIYKFGTIEGDNVLTNCRIVWLHNEDPDKFNFTVLGKKFGITRQRAHCIYRDWKSRPEVTKLVMVYPNGHEATIQ